MGHTTKSARFTGLLGLLVIGGLLGLSGTGVAVDSAPQKAQTGSADYSGLQPPHSLANRSAATGAILVMAPVSGEAGHSDGIPGIPFEVGRDQVQREVPGEPSVESFGESQRLAFDAGTVEW